MRFEIPEDNSSKDAKSSANNSRGLSSSLALFSKGLLPPSFFNHSNIYSVRFWRFRFPRNLHEITHGFRKCDGRNVTVGHKTRIAGVARFIINITADLYASVLYEERLAQLDVRVHVDADVHAFGFNEYIHARRRKCLQIKADTSRVAD